MIAARLELLALGDLDPRADLRGLADELRRRLGFGEVAVTELPVPREWREPGGERVSSNAVVDALIERGESRRPEEPSVWTLAVTSADLYAPGRGSVYGEATLGGRWAVISTARLLGPGLAPPGPAERRRLLTEAIHELGHLAGLEHCSEPTCVMHPVRTLYELDRKGPDPCPLCRVGLP